MEEYGYQYASPYPKMQIRGGEYPDHGDGFGDYYGMEAMNGERETKRRSRSQQRKHNRDTKRSRSRSKSSHSRTRSQSHSISRSLSRRSRSHSKSRSRSRSRSRRLVYTEPSFLDAFRVLYLTPSKHKKSTTKYLATKKKQDKIQEILKSDGLGSKRWLFYPRVKNAESAPSEVPGSRDNCDKRVKVDGDFFRKYKKSKRIDADAPIAKLKRWELILYKKLGFIQAV
ncbi:unnamed protein product [Danaus chrysippus]|uniref:(African queen) hypothetical protein n=1 Tax=Danaus chrysippus TaxID=151541 RepID=A0A8J2QUA2_9NEOP|nr:unnamed protein product [Danaus chrysippus]